MKSIRRTLGRKKYKNQELESKISEVEIKYKALQTENKELTFKLKQQNVAKDENKNDFIEIKSKLEQEIENKIELEKQVDELKSNVESQKILQKKLNDDHITQQEGFRKIIEEEKLKLCDDILTKKVVEKINSDLEALEDENEDLKKQNSLKKEEIVSKERLINESEKQVFELTEEKNVLQSNNNELKLIAGKELDEQDKLKAEAESLKVKVQDLQKSDKELKSKLDEGIAARIFANELEKQVLKLTEEKLVLQSTNEELKLIAEKELSEQGKLNVEVEALKVNEKELKSKLEDEISTRSFTNELEKQVFELTEEKHDLQSANEELKSIAEKELSEQGKLKVEVEALTAKIQDLQKSDKELKSKLEEEIVSKKRLINESEKQVFELTEEKNVLQSDTKELKLIAGKELDEQEKLKAETESLKVKIQDLQKSDKELKFKLEEEIASKERLINESEKQVFILTEEKNVLQSDKKELELIAGKELDEKEKLKAETESLKVKFQDLQKSDKELKSKLEEEIAMRSFADELEKQVLKLTEEKLVLQSTNEEFEQGKLNVEIEAPKVNLDEKKLNAEKELCEQGKVKVELEELKSKTNELVKKFFELKADKRTIQCLNEELKLNAKKDQSEQGKIKGEIEALKVKIQDLQKSDKELKSKLEEEIASNERLINESQKQVFELTEEKKVYTESKSKLEEKEASRDATEKQVLELTEVRDDLMKQIEKLEEQNQVLLKSNEEFMENLRLLKNSDKKKSTKSKLDLLEEEIIRLKNQNHVFQKVNSELKTKLKDEKSLLHKQGNEVKVMLEKILILEKWKEEAIFYKEEATNLEKENVRHGDALLEKNQVLVDQVGKLNVEVGEFKVASLEFEKGKNAELELLFTQIQNWKVLQKKSKSILNVYKKVSGVLLMFVVGLFFKCFIL